MIRGRLKHDWHLNSYLIAAICNGQLGRKDPVYPHQVNPMHEPGPVDLSDVFGFD